MSQPDHNKLSQKQIEVLKNKATEAPFSGKFNTYKQDGIYICGQCHKNLFSSEAKFDSGSGWPSYFDVIDKANVKLVNDVSHGMIRTEVICANCGGHLGHVFDDGPIDKTGKRYCINSASLCFRPNNSEQIINGD